LDDADIEAKVKTQPTTNTGGRFTKDTLDLDTVMTCPNGAVALDPPGPGRGTAQPVWHGLRPSCPLAALCTTAKSGRKVAVSRHERLLAWARDDSTDPDWRAGYRATRPKLERQLAHLMLHRHGGRRARMGRPNQNRGQLQPPRRGPRNRQSL